MPKYKLVVFSKPTEGREGEYNDWYQNTHLPDVVAIDGFTGAQRFKHQQAVIGEHIKFPYLAIYDVETNDMNAALADLQSRVGTERMQMSTALSDDIHCAVYEALGEPVAQKQ